MIHATQLEESKTLWNDILAHEAYIYPFYTYQWHMVWKKILSPNANVVVYHSDDVFISLVISNAEAHFSGGEEIADYLDALGNKDKKESFWQELLPFLKDQGIQTLKLRNIPAQSPTKDVLTNLGGIAQEEDMTPTMTLPDTQESYLQSLERKYRHEFKRKIKKFELQYPNFTYTIQESVDMTALIKLMKRDEDKTTFLTKEMELFFSSIPSLADVKMLQANLSTVDNQTIASSIIFVVDKTLLLYNSGFNADYQGSGWYLKAKTILWAIEYGYTEYNFLQGKERYKYELGAKDAPVYSIQITL